MDKGRKDIPNNSSNSSPDKEKLEEMMKDLKEKIDPTEEQLEKLKEMTNKYTGKSEEELMMEVMKLNKIFNENLDSEAYQARMEKLESIRPLLNEEQQKKLNKLIEILEGSR